MSLTAGDHLGPYEIVSLLGAGGMGEVYRATDGRLNRTVAIKILSKESAADADRRGRFEREAKAISALDHPNICALYDVGEHEGTYFLVMPCLEGQTLADRIAKGPLPPDQVIKCALEIATALDAAHRHGIIHRDLKPGNIMLTRTGVKLLDFGIAKLKNAAGPLTYSGIASLAGETTRTIGAGVGTPLGTMPYMAPEQVEGRDVDARNDIFSLGAVIYEMVTGRRAFKGDSRARVIGAILKDEPPPMRSLQPLTPAALDHVVTNCLAKDPDERWQSAADVARELKWIASSGFVGATAERAPSNPWRERSAWIAVTAALLAALGIVSLRLGPVASPSEVARVSVNPPVGTVFTTLTSATVATPQFAVSPDGRSIAFVASADELGSTLWLRSLDEVDARALPGTGGAREPFWSPGNDWIGFFDEAGTMKRIQVSGGTVRTIALAISDPRGASWTRDDEILFGTAYGGLFIVPAGGGEPRPLTQLDRSKGEGSHRWPQILPSGQHFLFTVRSGIAEQRGAYAASRDGTVKRLLISTDGDLQFVAPNTVLFLDGDTLLSQLIDLERLQLTGVAIPVAANVASSSRGNGAFSASNARTLAYSSPTLRPSRLTWFNRNGTMSGVVGPSDRDYVDFRLSPDETRLAMSLVDPKASLPDIWLSDLVRGGVTRFTFGPNLNSAPVWSPAGDRIVFRSNRRGLTEIYERSAGAGGNDQPFLLEDVARRSGIGASNLIPTDWSSDGKYVALSTNAPSDIWLASTGPDKAPVRVVSSIGEQMHANFSPDGRFLAYTSTESGRRFDVYVETLPPSDRKWPISTDGGYEPRWRSDGKEIYYLSRDGTLMAVPVSGGATPFGVPRPLFQTHVYPGTSILRTHYVPNRDGSRFLVSARSAEPVPVPITVVLNWTAISRTDSR